MPERLDRITIKLSSTEVTLGWATRQLLLDEIRHHPLGNADMDRAIIKRFEDVGATRPVTLDLNQKPYLLSLIEHWSTDSGGYDGLPQGLFQLRNALIDDLHEAAQQTND